MRVSIWRNLAPLRCGSKYSEAAANTQLLQGGAVGFAATGGVGEKEDQLPARSKAVLRSTKPADGLNTKSITIRG